MIRINLGGRQLTSSHVFFAHDLRTHGPFLPILLGGGSNATVVTETTASSINLNVVDDEDDMDDELD